MQDAWPENRKETIVFLLYHWNISNFTLRQGFNLECWFPWSICAKRVYRKHTRNRKTSFFNRETHSKGSILSLPWLWWHKVWCMPFCNYGKPIMQDMQHMHKRAQMHNWWLMLVIIRWSKNRKIAWHAHANVQLMIKARWLMIPKICCVHVCNL